MSSGEALGPLLVDEVHDIISNANALMTHGFPFM